MDARAPDAAAKMDGIYRYQRLIYDATRRYYLFGRDRLIADLKVPEGGSVLEIGCGTARNLILAARRYPSARLYGLDVSAAMLKTAQRSVARRGLGARITLAAADATAFDAHQLFGTASFDRIFVSYALSMIPPWRDVVSNAARCISPNGTLHIVDFGDFAGYPSWVCRAQLSWLRLFSVVPIPDFERELAAVAAQLDLVPNFERLYGGYAIAARLVHR